MNRYRLPALAALLAALALAAGCGKKPEPGGDPDGGTPGGGDEKAEALKRLKAIGKAIHEYESAVGRTPAGFVGPKGEFGLSWRVQILPYLGKDEAKLYEQFNTKEPWDSEQNKKLIAKMPKVFASPGKAADEGKTHFRSFVGPAAFVRTPPVMPGAKGKAPPPFPNLQPGTFVPGIPLAAITDGTSNTLMVAEAAEAVEWTKPDELPYPGFGFEPTPPAVPKLGGPFPGGFHGLMCDGAAHFFPATLKDETVRAMITTSGGEVLPEEVTKILFPPKPKNAGLPETVPDTLPDAAARKTAVANYRKILKGMHDHHDAMRYLPAGIVGPNKAVGLSWRVQVLPYIGEEALYKEFKLTEAWDSEHNKKLIEKMPKAFESPGKAAEKGHTFVRTTTGPGGIIPTSPAGREGTPAVQIPPDAKPGTSVPGRIFPAITDGIWITILFVEAGEAVPWTKPDELFLPLPLDPKGGPLKDPKLPPLGGVFGDGFHVAMVDGRVTFYKTGYPAAELAKMFCPADGQVVEPLGEPEKIGYSVPPPARAVPPKVNPIPKDGKGGLVKSYDPPK